jgi:2-dehydro-3-deoxygluconokinase
MMKKSNTKKFDVVSLGEPLVQFNPLDEGPLKHASLFEKHAAGSESNIVIGLSRLGFKTCYIAKVGKDEFSKFILSTLRSEQVNIDLVKEIDTKNCGIFFVQRNYPIPAKSDVVYYRSDSAAKLLSPEDIPEEAIQNSKVLHVSGITPALSKNCREACLYAMEIARKNNVKISFDTNYRRKLWSASEARTVLMEMATKCDILFTDPDDVAILFGGGGSGSDNDGTLSNLSDLGPSVVVLKLGATKGLVAITKAQPPSTVKRRAECPPIMRVPVVDSIGAGDAVVVGFLAGYLSNESLERSLEMASCCSALVVMRKGDFENLPDKEQLQNLLFAKKIEFEVDLR